MRYSVKRIPLKAALLYMTVFVIILAAHGGITFWNVTGSLEKELNQANMALLRQMNQKIDMTLREIDKLTLDLVQGSEVNQFVENPNLTEPDKLALFNSISEQMRSRTYANDMVHSIYLYSMVNGLIATNSRLTNRADFFDTGWLERSQRLQGFANWLPSRPVVMNPNTDSAFEKKFITLIRSYPFNASGDSRKGVIALNIDESKLARMVRDEHEGPGFGTLFIADAEENLISLDDNKEDAALDIRQAGYTALLEKGAPEGFTKLELNGKEAIVYHTVSPYNGWR
jgi:two-component system response regulator YesN